MICKNCGQENNGENKFCVKCGQPIEAVAEQAPVVNQETVVNQEPAGNDMNFTSGMSTQSPNKNKMMMGVIAAVAVVAVILVIVLASALFGKNEKTPIDNIEKIANKKPTDVDSIVEDVAPSFLADAYFDTVKVLKKNDNYKDLINDIYEESEVALGDAWEDVNDDLEDEYGKKVKFSYTVEKKEKIEKDDLETIAELYQELGQYKEELVEAVEILADATELEEKEVKKLVKIVENLSDEFENFKITKGYELKLNVVVEGKDDDNDEDIKLAVIKANGEWMIDPIMSYAINNKMDADDIMDMYEDSIKDYIDEYADELDDALDYLEESLKDVDEDILETYLEEILSSIE